MKMRMPIRYGAAIMSAALATCLCVSHASAQCTPEWKEGYTLPGIAGTVHCSIMHDDGTGPKLYVGGNFFFAGGTKAGCVARWNGTEWEQVGETFFANPNPAAVLGTVRCFAVYNGELYAGGQFRRNGLVTVNNIAKWDGSTWSGLVGFGVAGVLSNVAPPRINAMATYDDGTGTKLYVTGQFNEASGVPGINSIAKWDGTQFDYVGDVFLNGLLAPGGGGAEGLALKVYNGKLFVGGYFGQAAGTATTNNIATWSNTGWGSVGELDDNSGIRSFEIFDEDGAGPNAPVLAVAGSLTTVGIGFNGSLGLDVRGVARFDGNAWTTFGAGLPRDPLGENTADVLALAVHDNGSGPRLYAAGWPQFDDNGPTNALWMWNGTDWVGVSGGPVRGSSAWGAGRIENGGTVSTLLSADLDGAGPAPHSLIAGGTFDGLGSTVAPNIAALTGGSWGSMPGGQAFYTSNASALNWLNAPVAFIAGDEDGAGPKQTAVYAYGNFVSAGDVMAPASIVRRDGDNWVPLASGPGGPTAAAVFHNDGTGTRLYTFQSYGYLDRWDGTAWSDVANVEFTGGNVRGATSFDDDGAGPNPARIYVCGFLHGQEGGPVGIGRWTGSAWQTVTSANVPGAVNPGFSVYTLSVYDGDLYAAGSFDAVDMSISYGNALARWDGTSWQIVGEANGIIVALQEFGGVLYVGGQFASIGGVSSPGLARFDGTNWSDVGGGVTGSFPTARSYVASLGVADDGTGSKLFVGGPFLTAGGVAGTRGIAKWDGVEFSPLDIGVSMASAAASPPIAISTSVTSVAGVNSTVFFAGNFNRAGTALSFGVAEWGCEGSACTADFNGSGSVTADDIFAFLDAWFAQNGQTGVNLSSDFNNSQSVTADDIFAFLDAWFQQNGQPC